MLDVENRIRKNRKRLKRLAHSCYRLYDKDLPDAPFILDWYDGDAVVWLYDRTRDDTEEKQWAFRTGVIQAVTQALEIDKTHLFIKQRRRQKGVENQYEKLSREAHIKTVQENGLKFEVNLSDYLDTGLFLDHRNTRKEVMASSDGKRVLNLFAYTGSFTCYAAAGNASHTTTVDLSSPYIEWAKRNFELNGFEPNDRHRFVVSDCMRFLESDTEYYDIIVCDPPTFSNSKKAEMFSVDEHYPKLIQLCLGRLSETGVLYFSTNSRKFKLDPQLFPDVTIQELTPRSIPEDFRNTLIHRCYTISKSH